MQSGNIFNVGGSISVNVHGWQVNSPPLVASIKQLRVLTADGQLLSVNTQSNPELYRAIVGGYGMFGVIIEAELATVPNSSVKFHAKFMPPQDFVTNYQQNVSNNPRAELAYGRVAVDDNNLFDEVGLFWYERVSAQSTETLKPESLIAMKRTIFRFSQYTDVGKRRRWTTEKNYAKAMQRASTVSRNNAMNTDIHILWPLYGSNKDILHEYFIPKDKLPSFLKRLKQQIKDYDINVLNVTIREVKQDDVTLMAYAKTDMFAFVCLFSQAQNRQAEESMQAFTQNVINHVLKLNGSFYLPYRLHYRKAQLAAAYPNFARWLALKKQWDPDEVFYSQFYRYLQQT